MRGLNYRMVILIGVCIFFSFPYTGASTLDDGMIIESGYDSIVENPPDDVVKISFWELSLRSMVLFTVLAFVPVLVFPVELLFALKVFSLLGLRRLSANQVLDHTGRNTIYEIIRENPGFHISTIAQESGMNRGTIKYHLAILEITGKISQVATPGFSYYYENNGVFTDLEKKILHHMKSETKTNILRYLLYNTSTTRTSLAESLGCSGPNVTWHIRHIRQDLIITEQRDGKFVRYDLHPDAVPIVQKYLPGL